MTGPPPVRADRRTCGRFPQPDVRGAVLAADDHGARNELEET
ncbi:hypothetical protein [Jannaschia faecimaris]|nr:hypothetical protein [Jannaschia faecimaris]